MPRPPQQPAILVRGQLEFGLQGTDFSPSGTRAKSLWASAPEGWPLQLERVQFKWQQNYRVPHPSRVLCG
jgi:hypothetical protein